MPNEILKKIFEISFLKKILSLPGWIVCQMWGKLKQGSLYLYNIYQIKERKD